MTGYGILNHPGIRLNEHVNAHLLRTRIWHGTTHHGRLDKDVTAVANHLRLTAKAAMTVPVGLIEALHDRRRAAAVTLADRAGHRVVELDITPLWRVAVGHGEDSVQDNSLTLHQSYGIPVWPGSGLKGAAVAQGRARTDTDDSVLRELFGSPRPDAPEHPARQGSVVIFDALPVRAPRVVVDVLTPHVKPYYDQVNSDNPVTTPPADYHNPVPVFFLAVERTPFRTVLIGPSADVDTVAGLIREAADDLGLGAKTSAGYGYCTVTTREVR